jgi:hypothetical protein
MLSSCMGTHNADEDRAYRDLIDRLVHDCRAGQGQIAAHRARTGLWNQNATAEDIPDQHEVNVLFARLPRADREVLARLLEQEFVSGVHAALVALHEAQLPPFDKAYEGTPFHDFMGRLVDWDWPASRSRT